MGVLWKITFEVRCIRQIHEKINYKLSHTFRENNNCADCLANLSYHSHNFLEFPCMEELPHVLKGLVRMDGSGILNLRCKRWRNFVF